MDEAEEILPYEDFEDEILRARENNKQIAKNPGSTKDLNQQTPDMRELSNEVLSNGKDEGDSADESCNQHSSDDRNNSKSAKNDDRSNSSGSSDAGSTVINLSHITAREEPKKPKLTTPKVIAPPGPCFDFQKGMCLRGESCRWSHAAVVPVSERPFNSAFHVPTSTPDLSEEEKAKRSRRVQKFGVSQVSEAETVPASTEDDEARKNRIKRFGEVIPTASVSPASVDPDLIAKAQANPVDLSAVARPVALHICGTWLANKKTKQILDFFADYAPSHVEWIDLFSCNAVFNDPANTRRALFACSHPPDLNSALTPEQQAQATALNITATTLSSWVWRLAFASRSSAVLLMRIATEKDVKIHPAERKGFTQYFSQHLAPQFPSDVPKLVKVGIPAESLVDDADLKATVEAKETVDEKGRTIRGRGLKVSGLTRGIGPLYVERPAPIVTMPAKLVVKQEPVDYDEETKVKVEGSNHKIITLKGDPTRRKRVDTAVLGVKKRLLVTKRGDMQTLRSSPDHESQVERVSNDRSISPQSRYKKPKKIITSRRVHNSPSSERRRSSSPQVSRNKLRMDDSHSRSFSPVEGRKRVASKPKMKKSPSRSHSPVIAETRRLAVRGNAQHSLSRSPARAVSRRSRSRSYSQSPAKNRLVESRSKLTKSTVSKKKQNPLKQKQNKNEKHVVKEKQRRLSTSPLTKSRFSSRSNSVSKSRSSSRSGSRSRSKVNDARY